MRKRPATERATRTLDVAQLKAKVTVTGPGAAYAADCLIEGLRASVEAVMADQEKKAIPDENPGNGH